MKHLFRSLPVVLAALLLLSGCIQTETEYFLNPDGSGKVVFTIVRPLMAGMLQQNDGEKDYEKMAKKEVASMLEASNGISAWKDVSYKVTELNKLQVTGTAYFKDFSKVQFKGDSFGEKSSLQMEKTAKGMTIQLVSEEQAAPAAAKQELTAAEVKKQAAQKKAEFQQQQMMLNMMLTGLRADTTIHLPGKVGDTTIFKETAPNSVQVVYDGGKILAAINKFTSDDAWWEKQVAAGAADQPPMAELNQELFGDAGPPQVQVAGPLKPLFNYQAEVAVAHQGRDAMRKRLGLAKAAQLMPMATGGEVKNVRVGGIRLIRESDQEADIRPFNWNQGHTVAVIAELPGAALKVKKAKVTKAVTDNGEDLLPEREWDRRISFPKLSKNHTVVILEAKLGLPSKAARGLRELAGDMIYVSSAGTRDVDLGTLDLKAGVKAKELGAEIKSIKASNWPKGSQELQLKLDVKPETIADIKFLDAQGQPLKVSSRGMSWSGNQVTKRFTMKGEFPPRAHVIVVLHDKLKEYQTTFKLENIDFIGNPMGK